MENEALTEILLRIEKKVDQINGLKVDVAVNKKSIFWLRILFLIFIGSVGLSQWIPK